MGENTLLAEYAHKCKFNSGSQMALDKRENLWFIDEKGGFYALDSELKVISSC